MPKYNTPIAREKARLAQARFRANNPEKVALIQKNNRVALRMGALNAYGAWCRCCNEQRVEFLAIDHINGGGTQHRISLEKNGARKCGSRQFFLWLKRNNYPAGYRVLCHNCNMSLGAYGYCPHQKEQASGID